MIPMKKQTNVRLTNEEKRALRMLAGALGLSVSDWTSEMIQEKWNEMFPDMEYPDKEGKLKPKAKKGGK
jgi:predicted DNA-binding protein